MCDNSAAINDNDNTSYTNRVRTEKSIHKEFSNFEIMTAVIPAMGFFIMSGFVIIGLLNELIPQKKYLINSWFCRELTSILKTRFLLFFLKNNKLKKWLIHYLYIPQLES